MFREGRTLAAYGVCCVLFCVSGAAHAGVVGGGRIGEAKESARIPQGSAVGGASGMCAALVELDHGPDCYKVNGADASASETQKMKECLPAISKHAKTIKNLRVPGGSATALRDAHFNAVRKFVTAIKDKLKADGADFPLVPKDPAVTSKCNESVTLTWFKEWGEADATMERAKKPKVKWKADVELLTADAWPEPKAHALAFVIDPYDVEWDDPDAPSFYIEIPADFGLYATSGDGPGDLGLAGDYEQVKYLELPTDLPEAEQEGAATPLFELDISVSDANDGWGPTLIVAFDSFGHLSEEDDRAFEDEVYLNLRDDDGDGTFLADAPTSIVIPLPSGIGSVTRIFTDDTRVAVGGRFRNPVPAVSRWGIVAATLLVLAAGTVVVHRGRRLSAKA